MAPPIVTHQWWSTLFPEGLLSTDVEELTSSIPGSAGWIASGQNIAYDWGCLLAEAPALFRSIWKLYKEGKVFDLGIAAFLDAVYDGRSTDKKLFNRQGKVIGRYSLAEVVKETLDRDDAKENDKFRLSYAMLEGVPLEQWPEVAKQYPLDDVRNGYEAGIVMLEGRYQNLCDHKTQAWAAFCMHLGAIHGVRTDPARVSALTGRISAEIKELKDTYAKKGFYRVEKKKGVESYVKNTGFLKELVSNAYNGSPPRTETGAVSTERVVLEDSGSELLEGFTKISKLEKFSTYFATLEEGTRVPINVKPNPVLATGRSSYEGLIQLMPRKGGVRECFVARPGTVWCSVDYAAVELSTLAQVCLWTVGQSNLADFINKGLDPHCGLGAEMTGQQYAVFNTLHKEGHTATTDIRQGAKAGNFGFPGMMGAPKFVIAKRREGMRVCELFYRDGQCGKEKTAGWKGRDIDYPLCVRCLEKAQFIRDHYLQKWTEISLYWQWVQVELEKNDGRLTQFVSGRVRGGLNPPAAANTMFQGLAADGAKRALIRLTEHMYLDDRSPLYLSRLVIFAHDEIILEIPEERAHDAAVLQAEIMVEEMAKVCPDVRISAEPALMRRWYKEAKAVYVDKKLVPWEPEAKHE